MNYGTVPEHVVFMNPRGEFEFSIKSSGYPLLEAGGEFLYSIHTDRSGLERIDTEGDVIWSMSFPTLLTTVALAGEECLLGLMDGRSLLVGAEGDVLYQHTPEAGRIPVVLAAAVSGDRNQIALISGIDPQTLTVIERRAGEFLPHSRQTLDSDFRREVRLSFGAEGRFLFYEVEEGLGVLEIRKKESRRVLTGGVLYSLDSGSDFNAAAFRSAEGSKLVLFRPLDSVLLSRELPADRLFVKVVGPSLILGFDGVLLRADLEEG
jgi:hypothetical protein